MRDKYPLHVVLVAAVGLAAILGLLCYGCAAAPARVEIGSAHYDGCNTWTKLADNGNGMTLWGVTALYCGGRASGR